MLGDEVVIEQGITAGEQVAISGSFKLRDAVLVSIASSPGNLPAGHSADVAQNRE